MNKEVGLEGRVVKLIRKLSFANNAIKKSLPTDVDTQEQISVLENVILLPSKRKGWSINRARNIIPGKVVEILEMDTSDWLGVFSLKLRNNGFPEEKTFLNIV